jgi:signal transduction histidine kinase
LGVSEASYGLSAGPLVEADQPSAVDGRDPGREKRLSIIFEISRILVTGGDQEATLSHALSSLIQGMDAADAGSIWLYEPSQGMLVATAAQGYDLDILKETHLAPGEAIAGRVYETSQALLCRTPDDTAVVMANMAAPNRDFFAAATAGIREPLSAIGVPLIAEQRPIGVLVLLSLHQLGGFADGDIDFLQRVADLLTLAIENMQLREEFHAAQALGEANRLKAELISTLAHEMRTPLTSIKGYSTALLLSEATFSPETQREFLKIINQECDSLETLIHDLLESSIIDAGVLRLEMQPVVLPRVIQAVTDEMAGRTEEHRFLVDSATPFPIVDADPDRITQVLRNLLDNAIKYSPDGGLIIVRAEDSADEVVVSVADQGLGIAPEHLHQLFDKYFRARTGLARHVVGSGLGLPICHAIVESHGGRIWAESVVGQGSTFYFTLPLSRRAQGREELPGGAE